mmetsp:Transcript_23021/g.65258  ORF Transcript_23021/g.65258 Transcript_23021/m.65258 type:complete len:203 (+) Transcript_23021:2646-3254(+)
MLLVVFPLPHVDAAVAVEEHAVAVLLVLTPLATVLLVCLVGTRRVDVCAQSVPLLAALKEDAVACVHVAVGKVHRHAPGVAVPVALVHGALRSTASMSFPYIIKTTLGSGGGNGLVRLASGFLSVRHRRRNNLAPLSPPVHVVLIKRARPAYSRRTGKAAPWRVHQGVLAPHRHQLLQVAVGRRDVEGQGHGLLAGEGHVQV